MSNAKDNSNEGKRERSEPPKEIIADETWRKTSEKILSAVLAAMAVVCLILIGLNPFDRPSTDEIVAAVNRNYMFSQIDVFVSRNLGRPGEQPSIPINTDAEWFPELTEFETIIGSVPAIARDVTLELGGKPRTCLSIFRSPEEYNQVAAAANKLKDIDRQISERRLTNKRKDDLSIYDLIEVLRIFRGDMGNAVSKLMFGRKVTPAQRGQDWVCENLPTVAGMGKRIQDYEELVRKFELSKPPMTQLKVIEGERASLEGNVNMADKVILALASKKLADFYDEMARERSASQEAVEAYVGGKGPLKDFLRQMPFFWLVAAFPVVCCWVYLRMITLVSGTAEYLLKPYVHLKNTSQSDLKSYFGLPEIRHGKVIQMQSVVGKCFAALPIIASLALFANCLVWYSNPNVAVYSQTPEILAHGVIPRVPLRTYAEATVAYYNYTALLVTWTLTYLCAIGIYYTFLMRRRRLLSVATRHIESQSRLEA